MVNTQTCKYNTTSKTLSCLEKTYKVTTIGNQTWMAENLNFGTQVIMNSSASFSPAVAEKVCPDNLETLCSKFGGLYQYRDAYNLPDSCKVSSGPFCNSLTTLPIKGICPTGWHIPSGAEWDVLNSFLGGSLLSGAKLKSNKSGYSGWDNPDNNCADSIWTKLDPPIIDTIQIYFDIAENGDTLYYEPDTTWTTHANVANCINAGDSYGFSALPAGEYWDTGFANVGERAYFWSAGSIGYSIDYKSFFSNDRYLHGLSGTSDKTFLSVRCVKDP